MNGLTSRSMTSVFWGGGGAALRILLQLGTQIALARILGPEQYGLFAIGAIVIGFSNFFSDIGIAYGLIQKKNVSTLDLRFVFTWQLIIGTLVTISIAATSPIIARFFGDAGARDVVSALSAVCLINALAAPSTNMLKRQLNFKQIQISQVSGYVVGYLCVGLPLAVAGTQVWALVAAWIVQSLVILVLQYAAARHSLVPLFWYGGARRISDYGVVVLITNITNWVIGNIDRVIVGRVFTGKEIGIYATTYNLVQSPTSALLGVLQPVFFSASARLSQDHQKMAGGYSALLGALSIVVLPVFLSVSAIAETVVLALYGSAWRDAAQVLKPLAVAMPLFLFWGITTPLLWSTGHPSREFKTQLPVALLWAAVAWFAANRSFASVGWSVPLMFAVRCYVIVRVAKPILGLTWGGLWGAVRGGVLLSLICGATAYLSDLELARHSLITPSLRVLIEIAICAVTYFVTISQVPGLMGHDLVRLTEQLASRAPTLAARALRALPDLRKNHGRQ